MNSSTPCGFLWEYESFNNFFKLLTPRIEPLTLGSQVQCYPPTPRGTPLDIFYSGTPAVHKARARVNKQSPFAWKFPPSFKEKGYYIATICTLNADTAEGLKI